ncbi:MAG: transglutaminase family protein [Planctomycetaceae bacterium]
MSHIRLLPESIAGCCLPTLARCIVACLLLAVSSTTMGAADEASVPAAETANAPSAGTPAAEVDLPVTELSERITRSLVMIRAIGRDNREQGHGTGFVISADGLIATARHVIGDRRRVQVELPDGRVVPATHVYPATEGVDLAVVRVDADRLIPLPLGTVSKAKTGQSVVAVGHPSSLKHSTFTGIISGFAEIEGMDMLQLAMTIERGASGEPVVDRQGRVLGMVTLKSSEVANVGFAVDVQHLKVLMEDPAPVPMSRWMTIGALDPKRWETVFGANWSQRAGRILVDGMGSSFGGRSLCLQVSEPPSIPYEVQVDVKLDDERGAAGLVFHSDGNERHYGFYPSNGNLRLTRFDGPDVQSWNILHNESHAAYQPDVWNTLKVRIETDRLLCYVNDQLVVTSVDDGLPPGRIGVAAFRGTQAEFRRFQSADSIPPTRPQPQERTAIRKIMADVGHIRPASQETVRQMQPFRRFAAGVLKEQARQLEQQAERLRQLAVSVHAADVRQQMLTALNRTADGKPIQADARPDLLKASLLIASLDNEEVDVDSYIDRVNQLADEVRESVADDADEADRLKALDHLLFEEYGFRGSQLDYYTRSNSYMNEVIDDREGLPITLSVLYMEVARRLDLNVVGLGLPGHYVVRFEPEAAGQEPQIIDVFHHGKRMTSDEAKAIVRSRGSDVSPEFFAGQSAAEIVERMLINLLNLAEGSRDDERVLRYLETLVALRPEALEFRAKRLEIRARTGRLAEAIADADWFLNQESDDFDKDRLYELRADLQRRQDHQQAQ